MMPSRDSQVCPKLNNPASPDSPRKVIAQNDLEENENYMFNRAEQH